MKFLRWTFRILGFLLLILIVFLAVSLAPVDTTPYREMAYYRQTMQRLAALPAPDPARVPLRAGWAKIHLTPAYTTPTGGYGVRRGAHWKTVHDSIFVRTLVLDNGTSRVAVVGLDMLITPPTVTEQLKKRLPEVGMRWENVYTGAIHTHNSLGGWAPGLVGELISGDFEERIVKHVTDRVLESIRLAQNQLAPVQIGYGQADAAEFLYNRLDETAPVDGPLRLLKLRKSDGQTALLCTFAGHATIIDAKRGKTFLSRDYPGELVDRLESGTTDFALFLAGAVGSMGPRLKETDDFKNTRSYADSLAGRIRRVWPTIAVRPDSALGLLTLPVSLREPHARILNNWRIRPWLFKAVYGDYPSEVKALRIGKTALVGAPADFSGELVPALDSTARRRGYNLMVTSFNGGYIGYVTPDEYYSMNKYETRDMNWFGPYNGAYFTEIMEAVINKL